MPFQNFDPNITYPAGTMFVLVLFGFVGLKYFATSTELSDAKAECELKIAALGKEISEKYCLKEDVEKRLDKFESDVKENFAELKNDVRRIYDKIDESLRK